MNTSTMQKITEFYNKLYDKLNNIEKMIYELKERINKMEQKSIPLTPEQVAKFDQMLKLGKALVDTKIAAGDIPPGKEVAAQNLSEFLGLMQLYAVPKLNEAATDDGKITLDEALPIIGAVLQAAKLAKE